MAEMSYVYAGTVRSAAGRSGGIFRQTAGDQRWEALTNGLPGEMQVHSITVHPANPEVVFIGTTKGTFRSADRGGRWERLALPDPEADIWSITVDPTDCRTVYAGCGPVGVYRSEDDGDHWKKLPDPGLPDRVHMTFPCRVMQIPTKSPADSEMMSPGDTR
jgi:photosystem II stability/assembly factor-like uncharacterized protein